MGDFRVLGEILEIEPCPESDAIRDLARLVKFHRFGRWWKGRGVAEVETASGAIRRVELMRAVLPGVLAGFILTSATSLLASAGSPDPDSVSTFSPQWIDEAGLLHFASEVQLHRDWASGEIRRYGTRFARSAAEIEAMLAKLDRAVQPGEDGECGAAVPPPDTDDEQAGAGDVRIRSIGSDLSAIAVVDAISPGWSGTFAAPSQLVRLTVSTLFQDRQHRLTQGGDFLVLLPGGSMRVGNRSLCVQRGRWPALAPGARVLVSGFWQFLPADLVAPLDLVPIRDGQLLLEAPLRGGEQNPSHMTEAEFEAWWQELKRPR